MTAKVQYNPTTKRVLYNTDTKRQLVVGGCSYCGSYDVPDIIAADVSGILVCNNPGVCCPDGSLIKILDTGIGWNIPATLQRGWWAYNENTGLWYPLSEGDGEGLCVWSEILYDDFGTFEQYNLADCLGGVEFTAKITSRMVEYIFTTTGWQIVIELIGEVSKPLPSAVGQIFAHLDSNDPYAYCVPYDIAHANDYVCGAGSRCTGSGAVTLTEVA